MLSRLADVWPVPVSVDDRLRRSLALVGVDGDAERYLASGYAASVLLAFIGWLVGLPLGGPPLATLFAGAAGAGLATAVRAAPPTLAAFRRTRALGDAVELVGTLALLMRLTPVPERATRAVASSGEGILARSLADWVARSAGTSESGLRGFGEEWSPWFPALERSLAAIEAAADADAKHRERVLDRAVDAVGRALTEEVASFAGRLHGPVTGLYAFGVLLPLALVGTLPAATAAGIPVTPAAFAVLYDVALPGFVAAAGAKLLADRPAAFSPPAVTLTRADGLDGRLLAVVAGLGAAVTGWVAGVAAVGDWMAPVGAAGCGVGAALTVGARPAVRERRRVRDLERGLSDALPVVGRAVVDGDSVEAGVERAGEATPGPAGRAFAEAAQRRRVLGVSVRRAFVGRHGPFARVGGTRSRAAVTLLATAVREGEPAGPALLVYADTLDEVLEHERRGRRALATVTRTLAHTGALFGPLVGGATVALAARMASAEARFGAGAAAGTASPLPTAFVGTVVGWYVLLLAGILTALATGLDRGLDGPLVAYRVGLALLTAVGAFLAGIVGGGLLLYV